MAQQAPLSTSLNVQNSAACPLTLANGFPSTAANARRLFRTTADTFAIDPNFRIGYAQAWQLSVQRDLPFALQMTATYKGTKGTHGPQEILPNSYPLGEANPLPEPMPVLRDLFTRVRAATRFARQASSNCGAGCAADLRRRSCIPIRSRSTTTHIWAGRAT